MNVRAEVSRVILTLCVQGVWVYKHTGETLHSLLDRELSNIINTDPGFQECFMASPEHSD